MEVGTSQAKHGQAQTISKEGVTSTWPRTNHQQGRGLPQHFPTLTTHTHMQQGAQGDGDKALEASKRQQQQWREWHQKPECRTAIASTPPDTGASTNLRFLAPASLLTSRDTVGSIVLASAWRIHASRDVKDGYWKISVIGQKNRA